MAVVSSAAAALSAAERGATMIQLRGPALSARLLYDEAVRIEAECPLPFVISGRADIALAAGADGVNLPESDLSVAAARRLLGPEALIGRSVHGLEAALVAEREGADYLVFGPLYETATHPSAPPAGLLALAELAAAIRIPVLGIGGAGPEREAEILAAGAAGYAAIGAFAEP